MATVLTGRESLPVVSRHPAERQTRREITAAARILFIGAGMLEERRGSNCTDACATAAGAVPSERRGLPESIT
jgi:hypothetical protein